MCIEEISNVFVIPHTRNDYIVYLPLYGILFRANSSAVNLFYRALTGDRGAQEKFGLSNELVSRIKSDQVLKHSSVSIPLQFKPTIVNLFLTSDCSMRCVYCYAHGGDTQSMIKRNYVNVSIDEIIKNAIEKKMTSIVVNYHGGGDIGVAWDLLEEITSYINKRAHEHNLNVKYSAGSNGILSDYQRKWIVKNIDSVTVSLDGDEAIQNRLRPLKNGLPSFRTVHETLKYFDGQKFNYSLRSTITSDSVDHLEKIISFMCTTYSARLIKTEPVYLHGRANDTYLSMPDVNVFINNFIKASKIAKTYGKRLVYSGARFDVITDSFCKASGASFGVTPDGNITSCYEVLDEKDPRSGVFFYGKIHDGKIWINQSKLDFLNTFTVTYRKQCEKCFAKFHCGGDCPAKVLHSASISANDNYRCRINRELTKHQLLEKIEMEN